MPRFDGFGGISTGTGTGYLDIGSTPTGSRPLSALADGTVIEGVWQTETQYEIGLYTKTGGATPRLTRTEILGQIDGTTNPVNWAAGDKLFYSGASARTLPSLRDGNVWLNHQYLRGRKLALDAADSVYVDSDEDGEGRLVLVNAEFVRWYKAAGVPVQRLRWTDGGAQAGPIQILSRITASPALNDEIGMQAFEASNSVGVQKDYARVKAFIINPNSAAEQGQVSLFALHAGAMVECLSARGNLVYAFPTFQDTVHAVLVGKAASNFAAVGQELRSDGFTAITTSGAPCAHLNRLGGNGTHIGFFVNGSVVGSLGNTGGTFQLNGAVMAHPSEWAPGGPGGPGYESLGWVVCAAEGVLDDLSRRHPLCSLSTRRADPCVYGVVAGRYPEGGSEGFAGRLSIEAAGSGMVRCIGPIARGDLLMSSDVPGCACRQDAPGLQAWTLGKATQSSPDLGGARLVPCTLMAAG